jgi:hypothetical protein
MKSGQSWRVVIPADLRPLLDQHGLAGLENDEALAKVWGLLEGRQDSDALFHGLLACAAGAHLYVRAWHKPWENMTRAERVENWKPQPATRNEVLEAARWATKTATTLKDSANPELAAALDAAIKANGAAAELLEADERAVEAFCDGISIDFQPNPHKKTLAAWRAWFGCVLCRWFVRNLGQPHRARAAQLADRFFYDCPGHVSVATLSRNYIRARAVP